MEQRTFKRPEFSKTALLGKPGVNGGHGRRAHCNQIILQGGGNRPVCMLRAEQGGSGGEGIRGIEGIMMEADVPDEPYLTREVSRASLSDYVF